LGACSTDQTEEGGMSDRESQITRYRPLNPGNPSPAAYRAYEAATRVLEIADDQLLVGDKARYRHWLIAYELENLWDRARQELQAERRKRPGLRGWLTRRFDI
jgi:hypothetical protein